MKYFKEKISFLESIYFLIKGLNDIKIENVYNFVF